MTKLEENSGGRRTLPSHLRKSLLSHKIRSVSKAQIGFYTVDMGAIVVLVGEGEEKNKRHNIMLFL